MSDILDRHPAPWRVADMECLDANDKPVHLNEHALAVFMAQCVNVLYTPVDQLRLSELAVLFSRTSDVAKALPSPESLNRDGEG